MGTVGRFLRNAAVAGLSIALITIPTQYSGAQIEPGPTFKILCEDSFIDLWPEIVRPGETTEISGLNIPVNYGVVVTIVELDQVAYTGGPSPNGFWFDWTAPSNVVPGKYTIEVTLTPNDLFCTSRSITIDPPLPTTTTATPPVTTASVTTVTSTAATTTTTSPSATSTVGSTTSAASTTVASTAPPSEIGSSPTSTALAAAEAAGRDTSIVVPVILAFLAGVSAVLLVGLGWWLGRRRR